MAATTFDRFRRFTTDACKFAATDSTQYYENIQLTRQPHPDGLERSLRFFQAITQILLSLVTSAATLPSIAKNTFNKPSLQRPLKELSGRLGLVRQFLRVFRFLDAFTDSYQVFAGLNRAADSKGAKERSSTEFLESSLDGLAGTFNGLYLLLETATLVDALGIPELAILGPKLELELKVESQRFWFLALAAGAMVCLLRLSKVQISKSPKAMGNETPAEIAGNVKEEAAKSQKTEQTSKAVVDQWRLRRKIAACLLDMTLPGSAIGWVPASKGTVAGTMLITSVLTGMDVWERCGKEVAKL